MNRGLSNLVLLDYAGACLDAGDHHIGGVLVDREQPRSARRWSVDDIIDAERIVGRLMAAAEEHRMTQSDSDHAADVFVISLIAEDAAHVRADAADRAQPTACG